MFVNIKQIALLITVFLIIGSVIYVVHQHSSSLQQPPYLSPSIAAQGQNAQAVSPSDDAQPLPTDQATMDMGQNIKDIITPLLNSDISIIDVNVEKYPDGKYDVTIELNGDGDYDSGNRALVLVMAPIYVALYHNNNQMNIQIVSIVVHSTQQDQYGNTQNVILGQTEFTSDEAAKFNWSNPSVTGLISNYLLSEWR